MSDLWMLTSTGKDHYLSGCGAWMNEIDVFDIAHALAQINRFCGHARRPYSVAEHSLLCADLAQREGKSDLVQLLCLVHDAHEAYTGDQASPAKNAIGLSWAAFEHLQADRVRRYLQVTTGFAVHRQLVHHYDLVALSTERRDLMPFDPGRNREWAIDMPGSQVPPASWVNLNSIERLNARWTCWRDEFLTRYFDLQRQVQAQAKALMTPPYQQA
jgi:hypothetical protein